MTALDENGADPAQVVATALATSTVVDGGSSVRRYLRIPEEVQAYADAMVVPAGAFLSIEQAEAPNGSSDWQFRLSAATGAQTDVTIHYWHAIQQNPDAMRWEMERFAVQGHPKPPPASSPGYTQSQRDYSEPEAFWASLEREAMQRAADAIVRQLANEKAAEIRAARDGGLQERRVFSAREVKEFTESSWLVRGFIPAQQVGILYGPSQSKKSFLSVDLVNTLASGLNAFHGRAVETEHSKALYLYGEGGAGVGRRIEGWEQEHHVETGAAFVPWVPYLGGGLDFEWLLAHVTEEKYDLIVVDTLSKAAMDQNLNYAHEWRPIFRGMDALSKASGGTVVAVAHPNKGGDLTGSYQQFADADFVIEVNEDEGAMQVTARKFKDAETGKIMSLKVAEVALGDDGDRKTLVLRSQEPIDLLNMQPDVFHWKWEHGAVVQYLRDIEHGKDGIATEQDVIRAVITAGDESRETKTPSRSTVQRRIDDLVGRGYLKHDKVGRTSNYSLVPGRTWPPKVTDVTEEAS